jgi:hypothetical protein
MAHPQSQQAMAFRCIEQCKHKCALLLSQRGHGRTKISNMLACNCFAHDAIGTPATLQ